MIAKKKIGISIDKIINDEMEKTSVNKSKLVNQLLKIFLKNKEQIKNFNK